MFESESDPLVPDWTNWGKGKSKKDKPKPKPIEVYSGEKNAIKDFCPPEVWDMIFKNLVPQDQLNCSRVCKLMATMFTETMTLLYFTLVLPSLIPYLDFNDLLVCTQISQSFRNIIHDYINQIYDADPTAVIPLNDHMVFCLHCPGVSIFNKFTEEGILHEEPLDNYFGVMIYKSVYIHFPSRDQPDEYQTFVFKMQEFLIKYGKIIRRLEINYSSNKLAGFKNLLYFILSKTPYLRKIIIIMRTRAGPQQINLPPLPDLPHLQYLTIETKASQFVDTILAKYGSQLRYLNIDDSVQFKQRSQLRVHWQIPEGLLLSRLQKVSVKILSMDYVQHFRRLVQSQQLRLKTLAITLGRAWEPYNYALVEAINQLPPGLEHLGVIDSAELQQRCNRTTFIQTALSHLRLPDVKRLDLNYLGYPSPRLLNKMAPALKKLVLVANQKMFPYYNINIMDSMVYKRLYNHPKYWKMCPPTLECVQVEVVYTSDVPEYFIEKLQPFIYTRVEFNRLKEMIETKLSAKQKLVSHTHEK